MEPRRACPPPLHRPGHRCRVARRRRPRRRGGGRRRGGPLRHRGALDTRERRARPRAPRPRHRRGGGGARARRGGRAARHRPGRTCRSSHRAAVLGDAGGSDRRAARAHGERLGGPRGDVTPGRHRRRGRGPRGRRPRRHAARARPRPRRPGGRPRRDADRDGAGALPADVRPRARRRRAGRRPSATAPRRRPDAELGEPDQPVRRGARRAGTPPAGRSALPVRQRAGRGRPDRSTAARAPGARRGVLHHHAERWPSSPGCAHERGDAADAARHAGLRLRRGVRDRRVRSRTTSRSTARPVRG